MLSTLVLDLAEDFRIVVENKLDAISTYVFLEQETWFETDVPFVRACLKPGMRVVDIGTNCGFYTLLAAQKVGNQGRVWGFEPGLTPLRLLKESLKLNGFTNVTLYEAAAGAEPGTAWFADDSASELSAIVRQETARSRPVRVESLDHLHKTGEISGVDFIKIDAEGFEEEVITGGKNFFDFESPLVMLEIVTDTAKPDMGPASLLQAQGYEAYHYNTGTECLVPLVPDRIGDNILNIFLCKPDRAASLKADGLLLTADDLSRPCEKADPALFWRYFSHLPIAQTCPALKPLMDKAAFRAEETGYYQMCAEYVLAMDRTRDLAERYIRLCRADRWIENNYKTDTTLAKELSFSRIWSSTGRTNLVYTLMMLIAEKEEKAKVEPTVDDIFLPVSARWEGMGSIDGNLSPWLAVSMADRLELCSAYSSIYTGEQVRDRYILTRKYGYLSPALERRAALATLVRGYEQFPDPVFIAGALPRNQTIWHEIAERLARGGKKTMVLDAGNSIE